MDLAANKECAYKYEAKEYDKLGKFILKIGNYSQDVSKNQYWMLYVLPEEPDIEVKPDESYLAKKGVSTLKINSQKHYLFWLRTVNISHVE
jgi:hypothetical protein